MSRGEDFVFTTIDDTIDESGFESLASEAPELELAITNYTASEDYDLSDLSDKQEMVLSILLVCSAFLSVVGSCTIVFKIFRSLCRNQTTTPYDRIILGLSCCDIVASFTYALGPFLLPSETSQRVWAIGDDSSCQKLGFLLQLASLWSIWYNAILSFYYLLTVRFQVKRQDFCRKYEPWLHLSGAIFFPSTALAGYVGKWYTEEDLAMTCWIGRVDAGCDESGNNCTKQWGELLAYMFGALPTIVSILAVIINNVIIYLFVRKSLKTNFNAPNHRESNESQESQDAIERLMIQDRLRNEAATQGFLYVSSFLIIISPAFAVQILDGSLGYGKADQGRLYPLLVLNSILLPLQGFINVFIYVRPSHIRFRAANPDKSFWFILKQALFDPNIPRLSSTTIGSSKPLSIPVNIQRSQSRKVGSNFSISLENIDEGKEDGSVVSIIENIVSNAGSISLELDPPSNSQKSV